MKMKNSFAFMACCAALTMAPLARAGDIFGGSVTDEKITASMKKAADYLLSQRTADGTWQSGTEFIPHVHTLHGSETALVLYALLNAGDSQENPRLTIRSKELAPAIRFVVDLKADSTYAASLQASVLAKLPRDKDPAVKAAIDRCRNYLVNSTRKAGGHYYSLKQAAEKPTHFDHSNSNYAVMGLVALAEAGIELPAAYWPMYENFWRTNQNKDGGWGYAPKRDRDLSTPTMTAAAIASICQIRHFTDIGIGTEMKQDKGLDSAWALLSRQYDPGSQNLYYLYSLERVGLATGRKYINTQNWYKEGAAMILKTQRDDGSWQLNKEHFYATNINPNVYTAYSLLFLARGRNPVLLNKLQYNGPWHARTQDANNLAAWVGKKLERPINWQIVTLGADEDWSDAPLLLITGSKDPNFSDEQVDKLRAFVQAGGLIFSSTDGAGPEFTAAMKKYAARILPEKTELRDLPADHAIFSMWAKPANVKLLGLSNGIRELWVHAPIDLGATWQRKTLTNKDHFELPTNLYLYATGKARLAPRLATLTVKNTNEPINRHIGMARVKLGDGSDPEPAAWPRMSKLAARFNTGLHIHTPTPTELDNGRMHFAHMTGTAAFVLDDTQRAGVKKYLDNGGLLFADAIGGNEPFAKAFTALVTQLYPDAPLQPVPADDALFAGTIKESVAMPTASYRRFMPVGRNEFLPTDKPRLQGIKNDGRWIVLFAADDVTSGLLGTNTWGIAGYTPESAQTLVRNIMMYAYTK